jgi:hypothetical protein
MEGAVRSIRQRQDQKLKLKKYQGKLKLQESERNYSRQAWPG